MNKKVKIFFFELLPCKNVFAGFAAAFLTVNILFLMPSLEYVGITKGIENYSFLKIIPQLKVGNIVKATRSNRNISPHGGAVPILKKIKEFGIPQVIRSVLGTRVKQSKYGYEDVFIAWILTALCGGTRLDHITKIKKKLSIIPGLKLPSHDTLGRVMKKLATEELVNSNVSRDANAKVRVTNYNDNILLNKMLIKATKRIGALNEGISYTLDIDATFLSTVCRGAKSKHDKNGNLGFAPMVCLIGDLPVYISLRHGDAGAAFMYTEALFTCIDLLAEQNIKVGRVRSDAAGYSIVPMRMLEQRGIKFVMRFPVMMKTENFIKVLNKGNYRRTEIQTANDIWDCEIADIPYEPYEVPQTKKEIKAHGVRQPVNVRLIALRFPTKEKSLEIDNADERQRKRIRNRKIRELEISGQLKQPGKKHGEALFKKIGGYTYKFYVTNDWDKPLEELVVEYNKRGDAERKFSFMKQDFGWRFPPFMWMNENLVFLIVASLANNIYSGMLRIFKNVIPEINLKSRLKDFQFEFIDVACSYVKGVYTFYNTDIEYELLI